MTSMKRVESGLEKEMDINGEKLVSCGTCSAAFLEALEHGILYNGMFRQCLMIGRSGRRARADRGTRLKCRNAGVFVTWC